MAGFDPGVRSTTGAGVLEAHAASTKQIAAALAVRGIKCTRESGGTREQRHKLDRIHFLFDVAVC